MTEHDSGNETYQQYGDRNQDHQPCLEFKSILHVDGTYVDRLTIIALVRSQVVHHKSRSCESACLQICMSRPQQRDYFVFSNFSLTPELRDRPDCLRDFLHFVHERIHLALSQTRILLMQPVAPRNSARRAKFLVDFVRSIKNHIIDRHLSDPISTPD